MPRSEPSRSATHSPPLIINLLGGFDVCIGDDHIPATAWRLRRAASLVKLLALAPNHTLPRDYVLELLWPDLPPHAANNNLHQALHVARRALRPQHGASPTLHLRQHMLSLGGAETVRVDVWAFETAAAAARASQDRCALERAIALYTGDLLPEDRYEDWAARRREALRGLFLAVLLDAARVYEQHGDTGATISVLRRASDLEPTSDIVHAHLMRVLAASGQRQAAMRQYHRLQATLRRDLGLEPEESTRALYQKLLTGQTPERPLDRVSKLSTPTVSHLPFPQTSLVGRGAAIAAVRALLETERLVSLIGTGGVGKTRLALEVARGSGTRGRDGVWFVPLATLSDPALVPHAVATALDVNEEHGRPLEDTIMARLRDSDGLIVLDNCEHLGNAVAHLVSVLLQTSPYIRILVTSRTPLHVPTEVVWSVPPLSVPDHPGVQIGGFDLERVLERSEALQLFLARAAVHQPQIALTPDNVMVLSALCRRLDGVPLAIELAAARVAVLVIPQIVARLDSTLHLLEGENQAVDPRQRSLRATLDWSYSLLSDTEQTVFRRLAVFAGGFDIAAYEQVAACSTSLDVLHQLVDKSLVLVETRAGDPYTTRYRLLETVRQYAAEHLNASGDALATHARHAALYTAIVEAAEPYLAQAEPRSWWERLERENDNLRAVLRYALDTRDAVLGARLVAASWQWWLGRGELREGRRWADAVLALSYDASVPNHVRARLLNAVGTLVWRQGENAYAQRLLGEALSICRMRADQEGNAHALHYLGAAAHHLGDFAAAERHYAESLAIQRERRDHRRVAQLLNNLGLVVLAQGNADDAAELLEESLVVNQTLDDRWSAAYTLDSLGQVELARHAPQRAEDYYAAALTILRDIDDRWCIVTCLKGMALALAERGEPARAVRLLGAAHRMREQVGVNRSPAEHGADEQSFPALHDQLGVVAFAAAWDRGYAMTKAQALADALGQRPHIDD